MTTTRRRVATLLGCFSLGVGALAQDAPRELRIGYRKVGLVVVARQQG